MQDPRKTQPTRADPGNNMVTRPNYESGVVYEPKRRLLKVNKPLLSPEDRIAVEFAGLLEDTGTPYAIVAGYVAILLGRARNSEDIDFIITPVGAERFTRVMNRAAEKGFQILQITKHTREGLERVYRDCLEQGYSIRVTYRETIIPNIELKLARTGIQRHAVKDALKAVLNNRWILRISPLELQVAYKFKLGSEKDIGDAIFLYNLMKDSLDHAILKKWCSRMAVDCNVLWGGTLP